MVEHMRKRGLHYWPEATMAAVDAVNEYLAQQDRDVAKNVPAIDTADEQGD